jgi:signal transduction histidine kinase
MTMPRVARLYLALLMLGAATMLAWWLAHWDDWPPMQPVLIMVLLILAVAAQQFPLEVTPGYKVTASSAAYLAALLALGPPAALALVAVAQLLGGLGLFVRRDGATGRRRRGPAGIAFNAAQLVLAFGLGGLVLAAAAARGVPVLLGSLPAALAIHLANTGAVAAMAGAQRRRPPWAIWLAGQRGALPEAVALYALGLALALLASTGATAPLLLVPPLALVHWALAHARDRREEVIRAAAELRATLEAIEQGVVLTDPGGRVRYANRRLGVALGLDVARLPGRRWADVLAAEVAPRFRDRGDGADPLDQRTPRPQLVEAGELVSVDGETRVLAYYRGPVREGGDGAAGTIVGRVEVYGDVSAANKLARAQREFLMVASHELKTPITTMGGYLELLARHLDRPGPPDRARLGRHVAIARDELGRLRRLSEDLVAAARARSGGLAVALRPVDLAALVRDTVERFVVPRNAATRGHRITCRTAGPLPGDYDAVRLEQVLTNLLGNALKYAPGGGEVAVEAWRAGGEARVSVRDRGIGVAVAEREKLFLPFYRAENAAQGSPEGLGLGLALSRAIVEAHGGRIWVEDAPDGGSIFHMALPLGDPAASADASHVAPAVPRGIPGYEGHASDPPPT